jgi:hypothetical protein
MHHSGLYRGATSSNSLVYETLPGGGGGADYVPLYGEVLIFATLSILAQLFLWLPCLSIDSDCYNIV